MKSCFKVFIVSKHMYCLENIFFLLKQKSTVTDCSERFSSSVDGKTSLVLYWVILLFYLTFFNFPVICELIDVDKEFSLGVDM